MRPAVPVALDGALREIKDMIRGETDARKKLNMISLLTVLTIIRRDWDSSVASRVEDIVMLSNLLKRGAELAPEPLRQSLTEALSHAEQNRSDLRISTLDTTFERLSKVLIDLQIWLESMKTEEEQSLLAESYSFLKDRARRFALLKWVY